MKHVLRYLLLLIVSGVGLYYWNHAHPSKDLGLAGWILVLFFTCVYAVSHYYIKSGEEGRPGIFVRRFMAATTLRFMLFLIVLVGYAFTHRETAVLFIFHFLLFYFLFTAVEVGSFYRHFRKKS